MGKILSQLIVTLLLLNGIVVSQEVKDTVVESQTSDYYEAVLKYFESYPPTNATDSMFYKSFNYLLSIEGNDSLKFTLDDINNLVRSNKLYFELQNLYPFRNKLDSLNNVRINFLEDYWERQRLQKIADTSDIASSDTLFMEILESVIYQDTINADSIITTLEPYNDSILEAVNKSIEYFSDGRYLNWVKQMRKDTSNFYIVDLEGDSTLIKLYDNRPDMLRVNLTDFWGKNVKAIVRDINGNSFRILVDNAPELNYETDEKAKKAIRKLDDSKKRKKKLTLQPIPFNPPKQRWIIGGNTNVDVSQIALHQWAKGGESSVSLLSGLELYANYKGEKFMWDNITSFRFGLIRQGEYSDNAVDFRTNEDKINLTSKYGKKIFGNYSLSLMGDFKSQFSQTFDWSSGQQGEKLSRFMSPGYVTLALGLDYKPNKETTVFLSPITSKSTFVLIEDARIRQKYGVDTTENVRNEMGAIFKVSHKNTIFENIVVENKLELFSNYLDHPQNIDVDWDLKIIFPVNDYIRANIATSLLYDNDVFVSKKRTGNDGKEETFNSKGIQFREMLTIGFTYRF